MRTTSRCHELGSQDVNLRAIQIGIGLACTFFSRSGALSRAARACRYRAGARGPELDRGGGRRLHGQFGPPYAAMADHLAPCYGNSVSGRGKGPPRRLWIEHH
jgi:hypothetical protein